MFYPLHRLAVRNTELLNYYANMDQRVRALIYAIRHWGKVRQLAGSVRAGPRLSNYALSLMVVYYLQTTNPPVLPTVDQLREGEGKHCPYIFHYTTQKNKTSTIAPITLKERSEFSLSDFIGRHR